MAHNGALSRRELALVAALLVSATIAEAARLAGVSQRSASRYLARAEVRAELARRQGDTLAAVSARLVAVMAESVGVLGELQSSEVVSAAVRVGAARAVLEHGVRLFESVALAERVSQLEAVGEARSRPARQIQDLTDAELERVASYGR